VLVHQVLDRTYPLLLAGLFAGPGRELMGGCSQSHNEAGTGESGGRQQAPTIIDEMDHDESLKFWSRATRKLAVGWKKPVCP
jgi:hypothetical protein